MIDSSSLTWSDEERAVAIEVLKKIRTCSLARQPYPADVFEAQAASKKNVSTEGVFVNERGQVYIIKRPSLVQNPTEPYPDFWHSPGVMHAAFEDNDEAFARLVKSELGDVTILERRGPIAIEAEAPPRAKFTMLIMPTLISGTPNKTRGQFVDVADIAWDTLLACHRHQILPIALTEARRAGWIAV